MQKKIARKYHTFDRLKKPEEVWYFLSWIYMGLCYLNTILFQVLMKFRFMYVILPL